MKAKPITIVGGGLAGLTLGIALRKLQIPVSILEAGHYPRHRVCGEFISGRGQETLARLGLCELLEHSGAVSAATAAFFSTTKSAPLHPLPLPAVCLSRYTMDHALAVEFRRMGGEIQEGQRQSGDDFDEGVVRATGRRAQTMEAGTRWFGLKAHARNVPLTADLEMHVSPRGYVGLCRVDYGVVNVCGLFRRKANDASVPLNWRDWLRGHAGSLLHQRLATAEFDENSFCSVAGISLRPQRAAARVECCIGDAITMIPPVTGNGMSMAFESAEMAIEPLAAWSRVGISWKLTQQTIARRCDTAFARRLAWAKWLQRVMLTPSLQNVLVRFVARNEWFWRTAFERTR
ncbi:MAG TPA: FAD-dependent monooxygenase [Candidatus Saccharimonadales bacterium]|nr:FAD-dependent monooxygenase [Candidatus Saccharimonadales bacterium]